MDVMNKQLDLHRSEILEWKKKETKVLFQTFHVC